MGNSSAKAAGAAADMKRSGTAGSEMIPENSSSTSINLNHRDGTDNPVTDRLQNRAPAKCTTGAGHLPNAAEAMPTGAGKTAMLRGLQDFLAARRASTALPDPPHRELPENNAAGPAMKKGEPQQWTSTPGPAPSMLRVDNQTDPDPGLRATTARERISRHLQTCPVSDS